MNVFDKERILNECCRKEKGSGFVTMDSKILILSLTHPTKQNLTSLSYFKTREVHGMLVVAVNASFK